MSELRRRATHRFSCLIRELPSRFAFAKLYSQDQRTVALTEVLLHFDTKALLFRDLRDGRFLSLVHDSSERVLDVLLGDALGNFRFAGQSRGLDGGFVGGGAGFASAFGLRLSLHYVGRTRYVAFGGRNGDARTDENAGGS